MPKRRRLNRDLVVAQAVTMADEAGSVEAVTLASLAQALDVRSPSLYNHVSSLDDLVSSMALYGLRRLMSDLRQASQGLVGREALWAMAQAYRAFAGCHPGIYPLTVRAADPGETELAALSQEFLQMLLLVMASLGLRGDDALHAIRGLRAVLHGFVSLEAAGGFKMSLDREESFGRLVAGFLAEL